MLKNIFLLVFVSYALAQDLVNCNIPCQIPRDYRIDYVEELDGYCRDLRDFLKCADGQMNKCNVYKLDLNVMKVMFKSIQMSRFEKIFCIDQKHRKRILARKELANCNISCEKPIGLKYFPDKKEILEQTCRNLTIFNECMDKSIKNCLSPEGHKTYKQEMEKHFDMTNLMCSDRTFIKKFSQTKELFKKMKPHAEKCMTHIDEVGTLQALLGMRSLDQNICCDIKVYDECMNKICKKYKCSAKVNKIMKIFIDLDDTISKCETLPTLESNETF